jgi:hypothetical protein
MKSSVHTSVLPKKKKKRTPITEKPQLTQDHIEDTQNDSTGLPKNCRQIS